MRTARQKGRLAPVKFEHAVLRTTELEPMLDWYLTVLQAEVTFGNASMAFLSYDEQNHRVALVARPGTVPRQPNSAGLDHLAFTYADEGELVATYERLKGESIAPSRSIDHGSSTSLYYLDPDGNQIELKVDSSARRRSSSSTCSPRSSPATRWERHSIPRSGRRPTQLPTTAPTDRSVPGEPSAGER